MEYEIIMDYKIIADVCCDVAPELREKSGSVRLPLSVNGSQHSDFLQKFECVFLKALSIQMEVASKNGI